MSIANKQFLLTVIFACYHCVKASVNDGPKFRLANGTVLKNFTYINVMLGSSIELFCTGGHADDLQVTRYYSSKIGIEVLTTPALNQTTVKVLEDKLERDNYEYYCMDTRSRIGTRTLVIVDSLPMVTNFHCISIKLKYINCSWGSDNLINYATLYYVQYSKLFLLCQSELQRDVQSIYTCIIWYYATVITSVDGDFKQVFDYDTTYTFLMNMCNELGCKNQTLLLDHNNIVKSGPPNELEISRKTSHSAALQWFLPRGHVFLRDKGDDGIESIDYRITYMYNGLYQYEINETRNENIFFNDKVGIEIKLPCADTFYKVKVSVKLHSAVGEEFWSDDAVTSFSTDKAQDPEVAVDKTCKPPELIMTPDMMRYQIYLLRREMKKKMIEIKDYIRELKLKRDGIKNLTPEGIVVSA
ncbi:uncharacterized protein [Choristoneura fumiferana]|uniref:uncharacterized protein n=1 Tax=Choristoneura fumiferana TaxID=7141 RepID=UPI003D15EA70